MPLPHLRKEKENEIEEQHGKILHSCWNEEAVFDGETPKDTVSFWCGVMRYENSLGNKPFAELANYVLACLTTPVSNAVVERIFSSVTCVKNKLRNRLGSNMLESIIRIRTKLQFVGKCCRDFKVSQTMLDLFNSQNMYVRKVTSNEDDEDYQELLSIINLI